jgi:pimeloyl-ACP methyl ester carboxylesterase
MEPIVHSLSAWDGLPLCALEWGGRHPDSLGQIPVLCLPGLVRTAGDFARVARGMPRRRVVALDYAGRGRSGRSRDPQRYRAEACLRDVMDACAALHLHEAAVIGTSFGGLLAMGLAAARPALIRAVVLNDIGPEIGPDGAEFIRRFIAYDPALPDLEACVTWLRSVLPPMSLETEEEWRTMASLTYAVGEDGRYHPLWDTRIVRQMDGVPDLWPLFGALAHAPIMLVRGEASEVLLPETVARMCALRPNLQVVSIPGIGHAPTLSEPVIADALQDFLDRVA